MLVLPFTQSEYDKLPSIQGVGFGKPERFYRTSSGVTKYIRGRRDGSCFYGPNEGYWLDFGVKIVGEEYFKKQTTGDTQ